MANSIKRVNPPLRIRPDVINVNPPQPTEPGMIPGMRETIEEIQRENDHAHKARIHELGRSAANTAQTLGEASRSESEEVAPPTPEQIYDGFIQNALNTMGQICRVKKHADLSEATRSFGEISALLAVLAGNINDYKRIVTHHSEVVRGLRAQIKRFHQRNDVLIEQKTLAAEAEQQFIIDVYDFLEAKKIKKRDFQDFINERATERSKEL